MFKVEAIRRDSTKTLFLSLTLNNSLILVRVSRATTVVVTPAMPPVEIQNQHKKVEETHR